MTIPSWLRGQKFTRYVTDYPFIELGDIANQVAPIRICELLEYDKDKYVKIRVLVESKIGNGFYWHVTSCKSGYVYKIESSMRQLVLDDLKGLPDYTY